MTPPGTRVLTTEPLTESRTTSAPALVTATIAGGFAAFLPAAAFADEAWPAPVGLAVTLPAVAAPPLPPPQAASTVSATGSASAPRASRYLLRRGAMPACGTGDI